MAISFTPQQQAAIDSRNNRLIVSAAAGSGKTAVLVQRVIELLCDPKAECGIEDLVVVTFTNAAASEMRSRIAEALHQRLTEHPESTRLRRQLSLLPGARIQTVHSFCQDLIRRNFTQCGVSADFRLMDEDESARLRDEMLDRLLEQQYQLNWPEFRRLCDAMRENRGDARLAGVITELYKKVLSMPGPQLWLQHTAALSGEVDPANTPWGIHTLDQVQSQIRRACRSLDRADRLLEIEVENVQVWRQYMANVRAQFAPLAAADSWDEIRALALAFKCPSMPRKSLEEGIKEEVIRLRDDVKSRVKKIWEKLLVTDSSVVAEEQRLQTDLVRELCSLAAQLLDLVSQEKRRRNQLDFNDLEHLTLKLLTDDQGGRSPLARELSGQIKELLVDEYQDTNELQDAIFERLSPAHGGVFLVGDLKQSIYRFRMAEPALFLEKYKESLPLEPGMEGQKASLALNMNFRSSSRVLELCNFIFERLMTEEFGGIDYDEGERLNPGPEGEKVQAPCEAWLVERAPKGSGEKAAQIEARFVAARISRMLREITVTEKSGEVRPARPGDFAILLSSFSNKEPYYSAELQKLHIPVAASSRGDYWNSPEILTVLSMLRVIDNRRQDIPLIGLMRSPIYLFTADELARIRLCDRMVDYADALERMAPQMPKAAALLADLDRYADLACDMSVSRLLRLIYEEKSLPGIFSALENGPLRRDNLEQLLQIAIRYERTASRGLYLFLQHIDRMILNERQPEASSGGDGVRIMSIHKSKGLEFPVVFLPDLAKPFNENDLREPVQIHKENGVAMKLRIPELHAEITTQAYASTVRRLQAEARAEELRKLYVAMTRARERLVLCAAVEDPAGYLGKLSDRFSSGWDPLVISECGSMADWVFGALLQHPGGGSLRDASGKLTRIAAGDGAGLICGIHSWPDLPEAWDWGTAAADELQQDSVEDAELLLRQIDMQYPYAEISALPSKLTPTGIKRLMPETGEVYSGPGGNAVRLYHASTEQRGSAAERGSANHLALSSLPLERCTTPDGLALELEKARAENRIPASVLDLVDPEMLLRFTAGPLGARMLAADRYLQEYEFGVLLPPEKVLGGKETGEQVLFNGVIDLLLFEQDGMTVIDFKTDNLKPGMAEQAAQKHKLQLDIYAMAAQEVFGLPVRQRIVFFLRTGEWALI